MGEFFSFVTVLICLVCRFTATTKGQRHSHLHVSPTPDEDNVLNRSKLSSGIHDHVRVLSCLSDFVTVSTSFYIQSGESITKI